MAQTKDGAAKAAAAHLGMSVAEYTARVSSGLKRCFRCQEWRPRDLFNKDRSRTDGLAAVCRSCCRVKDPKSRKGRPTWMKGRSHTADARAKMSASRRGNANRTGKPCTPEQRDRISERTKERTPRGPSHPRFIDGRGYERANRGLSPEDIAWRTAVFTRDGYACQDCGDARGGNLNAHHLKPWAEFPELRHEMTNGSSVHDIPCSPCLPIAAILRSRRDAQHDAHALPFRLPLDDQL